MFGKELKIKNDSYYFYRSCYRMQRRGQSIEVINYFCYENENVFKDVKIFEMVVEGFCREVIKRLFKD